MGGKFGSRLKQLRVSKGQTLREFCEQHGFDPGNYSKIERGLFAPPSSDKVAAYARALGVESGSDEYVELLDLATIDRGELPREFLSDQRLMQELPVLFRTLRGQRVDEEALDRLVQLIKQR